MEEKLKFAESEKQLLAFTISNWNDFVGDYFSKGSFKRFASKLYFVFLLVFFL